MNLCVVGSGYVGLVTGAVLADLGNRVICVDSDSGKIEMLQSARMPIYEPGLAEIVRTNAEDCRLSFSTDISSSVAASDVVFVAVGTPPGDGGYADLSAVRGVAELIGHNLGGYKIIVNKSTVPVGTVDEMSRIISTSNGRRNTRFDVVSNPEFLREGNAVHDALHPDRIIIGASNHEAAMRIVELYAPLECPMLITDPRSAEMIKYASNAFLATKISFINAIAGICEAAGADVTEVAKGIGYDKRIGHEFLRAGLGYGGSCFGKDTQCLVKIAERLGYDFKLLTSVIEINAEQPKRFVGRMRSELGSLGGKTIAILGLAFKPNTDDLRDAKSLEIISELLLDGAVVRAYDPIAMDNARKLFPQVDYCRDAYEALAEADAVAVVTEWDEFRFLNLQKAAASMARPVMFDGRNMFDPERMRRLGFQYHSVGRPSSRPTRVKVASECPVPYI